MGNYFQKDIECADREVIRDIQSRRLVEQVKHVWDNVAPYRKKMEEAGLTPDDIKSVDDLHKLPFTEKSFLRDNYPDGLLAVPQLYSIHQEQQEKELLHTIHRKILIYGTTAVQELLLQRAVQLTTYVR